MIKFIKDRKFSTGLGLVVFVIAVLIPVATKSNYIISLLVTCFAFASFGVAWNLIGGYGGQVSWCHTAFVAIGAYTAFLTYTAFGVSPFLMMPVGMAISYVVATLIGHGTLRLRGPYFSIATIAFAEILRVLLLYFKDITKGAGGVYITYTGQNPINLIFDNDKPFYYIMLAALLIILIITYRFKKSKTGYYLATIKGDEDAAMSLGIPTFKIKLRSFQLSAVITSAVGVIYAFFLTYIDPTSIAGMDTSVKIGVVAIIGGVGTLWGPVLGAFVIQPLIEFTSVLLGHRGGSQMLYGLALIIVVIFRPDGVLGLLTSVANRIKAKFAGPAEQGGDAQ